MVYAVATALCLPLGSFFARRLVHPAVPLGGWRLALLLGLVAVLLWVLCDRDGPRAVRPLAPPPAAAAVK